MLEIVSLSALLLCGHLLIRSKPLRLRRKLASSIKVYERLQQQRRDLLIRLRPQETPLMLNTLTHIDKRLVRLRSFIDLLGNEYAQLHGDPYARYLLRLPSPPRFEP